MHKNKPLFDVITLSGKEAVINELEAAGIPEGKVDELGDVFADVTTKREVDIHFSFCFIIIKNPVQVLFISFGSIINVGVTK